VSGTNRIRIGEVHAQLREEFPGIELSKIRYYEDKGLVNPARSRKGYRLYSTDDVACLREAFRLAQEEFVPLKVVRQRLIEKGLLHDVRPMPTRVAAQEHVAANVTVPVSSLTPTPPAPTLRVVRDDNAVSARREPVSVGAAPKAMSRDEFAAAAQLDAATLAALVTHGLLRPKHSGPREIYEAADLAVAAALRPLLARGVDVRLLQPLARIVDRQVDLVHDLTAPLRHAAVRQGVTVVEEAKRVSGEVDQVRRALLDRATQRDA